MTDAVLAIWVGGRDVHEPTKTTVRTAAAATTGYSLGRLEPLASSLANVPLALAYAAALLLAWSRWQPTWMAAFAPAGRMALSNYLLQSGLFSLIFYGFGAGQFGRMGSAAGALLALLGYTAQLLASAAWLRRFRYGPLEWLWRSLTYGRMEPMNRPSPL